MAMDYLQKCDSKNSILCMESEYLRNVIFSPQQHKNEDIVLEETAIIRGYDKIHSNNGILQKYNKFKLKLQYNYEKFKINLLENLNIANSSSSSQLLNGVGKMRKTNTSSMINEQEREFENRIIVDDNDNNNDNKLLFGVFSKFKQWSEYGTIETCSQPIYLKNNNAPMKTLFYTSKFAFSYSKTILNILEDERLGFLDLYRIGDSIMGLRLYTFGLKIYNPPHSLCYLNFNSKLKKNTSAQHHNIILQYKQKQFTNENEIYTNTLVSYYLDLINDKKFVQQQQHINNIQFSHSPLIHEQMFGRKKTINDFINLSGLDWKNSLVSIQSCKGIYPYNSLTDVRKDILIKYGSIKNYNKFYQIKNIFDNYYTQQNKMQHIYNQNNEYIENNDDLNEVYDYIDYINYVQENNN